jgi:hypothetical protein
MAGRVAKRVFSVLTIAAAAAFALAGLYALSMRSNSGPWLPVEIRSPGLLAAAYASLGFSPALLFLGATIRVLLPRGKRWYQWAAFALLELALLAALLLAAATALELARPPTYYEEMQGTMPFGLPRLASDERVLYVAPGRPRLKVIRQSTGLCRLVHDTSLPIRLSRRVDVDTLDGRWEVRDGAVHLATLTLRKGAVVKRERGADWVPSRGRIAYIGSDGTSPDGAAAYFGNAPERAVDGDPATAWVGDEGCTLRIELEAAVTADSLGISATGASRLELTLDTADGPASQAFALAGGPATQMLAFSRARTFVSAVFTFPDAERATIAELELYELGEKVELDRPPGVSLVDRRHQLPPFSDVAAHLSSADYRQGRGGDEAGAYELVLGSDGSVSGVVRYAGAPRAIEGGGWELETTRGELALSAVYAGGETEKQRRDYVILELVGPTRLRSIDRWYDSTYVRFDQVSRWPGSDLGSRELLWDEKDPFAVLRSLARYPQARLVSLRRTGISVVPEELLALGSLEELDLGSNGIAELPAEISRLRYLRRLDLSGNALERLPAETATLGYLEELDLSDNRLTALPRGLERLPHLRTMSLERNPLSASAVRDIERAFAGREVRIGF